MNNKDNGIVSEEPTCLHYCIGLHPSTDFSPIMMSH